MSFKTPKISNKRLAELRERIRPVARFVREKDGLSLNENGFLYYLLVSAHPKNETFFMEMLAGEKCKGLKPFTKIETHHTTGGFFFKPSEAEILAQIPEGLLDTVVAYEVVGYSLDRPDGWADDSIAILQLYRR